METGHQKDIWSPMFNVAFFTIVKTWEQPKCLSVGEQIKKMWDIHTMEYSFVRKKEILPFAMTWMDLEDIMLIKKNKDKYCVMSFVESKIKEKKESTS